MSTYLVRSELHRWPAQALFSLTTQMQVKVENWILELAASPWSIWGCACSTAFDGFFPPIPSESLAIALAVLSFSSGQPNLALIILFAATGAFTGDQIAYTIGKRVDAHRIPFVTGPRGQRALSWAGLAPAAGGHRSSRQGVTSRSGG